MYFELKDATENLSLPIQSLCWKLEEVQTDFRKFKQAEALDSAITSSEHVFVTHGNGGMLDLMYKFSQSYAEAGHVAYCDKESGAIWARASLAVGGRLFAANEVAQAMDVPRTIEFPPDAEWGIYLPKKTFEAIVTGIALDVPAVDARI